VGNNVNWKAAEEKVGLVIHTVSEAVMKQDSEEEIRLTIELQDKRNDNSTAINAGQMGEVEFGEVGNEYKEKQNKNIITEWVCCFPWTAVGKKDQAEVLTTQLCRTIIWSVASVERFQA
jgi:hypothetical protein